MIKLLGPVPRDIVIAVSGGIDSMAALNFLSKNHNVEMAFFNHGTGASREAERLLKSYAAQQKFNLHIGHISKELPKGKSQEEHWRDCRYEFLDQFAKPVVTAHNLNDVAETWIWSSLHGRPKLIPYRRNNVIRPFLTTSKKKLVDWCHKKGVPWIEDLSNYNTKYTRNYIRSEIMGHALHVNPGLLKTMRKLIEKNGAV